MNLLTCLSLVLVTTGLGLGLVACSDDAVFGSDVAGGGAAGAGAVEAGAGGGAGEASGGSGGTGQPCTGTLEQLQPHFRVACPSTYEQVDPLLADCETLLGALREFGTCKDTLVAVINWGTHSKTCYYDATTEGLVGVEVRNDTPSFCDSTSWSIVAGQVPTGCLTHELAEHDFTDLGWCVDGGAGGAGGGGGGGGGGAGEASGGSGGTTGRCTGTLEEVGQAWNLQCPSTYAEAGPWLAACEGAFYDWAQRMSGGCGDYLVAAINWGTHSKTCYYDANTERLVGADADDDVPSFCDSTSWSIVAGQVPTECSTVGLTDLGYCGDKGAGGTAGSGDM